MRMRNVTLAITAALALGACDSPVDTNGSASVRVLLTDAPADYLASAVVEIGRIEILPADDGPAIVLVEDAGEYDLLQLQNGVTAQLGNTTIDAGSYTQLRMIVESAELTLADGYTFTDGSTTRTLFVPSGSQTGIKVNLGPANGGGEGALEIRPGETVLVVDFDVARNFVMQGDAESPAGIQGFLFTPVLRAVVTDVAGSIAGSVTAPEGVALEGLQVTASREGTDEIITSTVSETGTFKLPFVAPATYTVTVVAPEGFVADSVDVTVEDDEDVTGVEIVISPAA